MAEQKELTEAMKLVAELRQFIVGTVPAMNQTARFKLAREISQVHGIVVRAHFANPAPLKEVCE